MRLIERFKSITDEEYFPLMGILGSISLCIALFIPQIGYKGRMGESFSMLNHFVSELGELGVSYLAILFNVGLIIGGLFFVFFMIGIGRNTNGIIFKIAALLGVISSVACSLVGVFPMTFLMPHYIVAMTFFLMAMITVLMFTIAIIFQKESTIPKLFIIPGLIVFGIYIGFFNLDFTQFAGDVDLESGDIMVIRNRPEIWILPLLEWAAVLSVVGYLLSISLYFYNVNK